MPAVVDSALRLGWIWSILCREKESDESSYANMIDFTDGTDRRLLQCSLSAVVVIVDVIHEKLEPDCSNVVQGNTRVMLFFLFERNTSK